MFTVEEVKNNAFNYKIENGIVIDKSNNQPVQDENKILEVKASILIYKEAKERYDEQIKLSRSGRLRDGYGLNYILKNVMEDFSVNNEIQEIGATSSYNKLTNEILNSNGHIQETWPDIDLKDGKYSLLVEPKKSYYLAYLKLKFREKGLDIDDITINIDTSTFKHLAHSIVTIDYEIKKYDKNKEQTTNIIEPSKVESQVQQTQQPLYQHPMANELNELERQKQIAKQYNDEDAYQYAQSNIERIIEQNQATISPEQWDSLSIDEQISFVRLKINESKILHDKDAFDYWNATLNGLEAKKSQASIVDNGPQEKPVEDESEEMDFSIMINQLKVLNGQIRSEYKSMLSDGLIDDEELTTLINRLNELSNNAAIIKSMVTNPKEEVMLDSIMEMIEIENSKMTSDLRDLEAKKSEPQEEAIEDESEEMDFSIMINQLRIQNEQIRSEYKSMLSDGMIDDEELAILINRLNELSDNATVIKSMVTNPKEEVMLDSIIEMIDIENTKMTNLQRGIEESNRRFGI